MSIVSARGLAENRINREYGKLVLQINLVEN